MRAGATLFAHLKQLLKLHLRLRDKQQMLAMIEEPTTLQLFRDLFTIFYEPLVRVYKSANVYNSITDFAVFADDMIRVVESAQRQDVSADPNQTVQAFIDLCARHEDAFYRFVHEVHIHDNGLFDQLMGWLEGILEFLRKGPRSGAKLDMNALFQWAVDMGTVDRRLAVREINALVRWQAARKKWHHDKTRQKMASAGEGTGGLGLGANGFKSSDFGLNEVGFFTPFLSLSFAFRFPRKLVIGSPYHNKKTNTICSSTSKTSMTRTTTSTPLKNQTWTTRRPRTPSARRGSAAREPGRHSRAAPASRRSRRSVSSGSCIRGLWLCSREC